MGARKLAHRPHRSRDERCYEIHRGSTSDPGPSYMAQPARAGQEQSPFWLTLAQDAAAILMLQRSFERRGIFLSSGSTLPIRKERAAGENTNARRIHRAAHQEPCPSQAIEPAAASCTRSHKSRYWP